MNSASLASIDYDNPLLWAVLVGWIISVTLHEFAHGLVAYAGGDYTIRQRGGLTLNPLHYANPLMTFILPLVFVLMGGIPLVGAATYVRQDLIRSRLWRSATALAGPATNLLLFMVCVIPLHPRVGWVDLSGNSAAYTSAQLFCGGMATLELFAVFINLLPVPPLDGFHVCQPFLTRQWSAVLDSPKVRMGLMIGVFLLLTTRGSADMMFHGEMAVLRLMGFSDRAIDFVGHGFNMCLFGTA